MKRFVVYVLAAVILLGGLFWYLYRDTAGPAYTGPTDAIRLGMETSLLPAPVWIAADQGYFEHQGLDVTIREYDSGRASLVGMLAGEVDVSAAAPTPIMFNSFVRDDFVYFGTFASSNEDIKLTVRRDSGIVSTQDLTGKTIGTAMGTTGQFVVDQLLLLENVAQEEVRVVHYAPSELPQALAAGDIDAMVIWEPHGNTANRLLGEGAVTIDISDVYTTTFNFLATDTLAQEQPEVLVRFLRAIDRAEQFIARNERQAQHIVATRLGERPEDVALFWDNFDFALSMEQSWLVNIENEARWAINNRFVKASETPNYLEWLHSDALRTIEPRAVTLIE